MNALEGIAVSGSCYLVAVKVCMPLTQRSSRYIGSW